MLALQCNVQGNLNWTKTSMRMIDKVRRMEMKVLLPLPNVEVRFVCVIWDDMRWYEMMEMKIICLKRVIGILLPPRPGWDRDHKSGGIRNQKGGASRRGGRRVVLHPDFCFRFFSSSHFCVFSVRSNVTNWTILEGNWPVLQGSNFEVKYNFQLSKSMVKVPTKA